MQKTKQLQHLAPQQLMLVCMSYILNSNRYCDLDLKHHMLIRNMALEIH